MTRTSSTTALARRATSLLEPRVVVRSRSWKGVAIRLLVFHSRDKSNLLWLMDIDSAFVFVRQTDGFYSYSPV